MAQICYRDVWDFLTQYQKVLDRNVGSLMFPIRYGDECSCESDEIITDTIRPYLWDLGWPELPTPQNTQGVAV